ncbi:proprotein convertase P-domain-containing protein, partial [Flavobacteriaceae bacterium]|nr:proprotein convertase P-domain-containing protein [Flavobacteriaceae bacterium]
KMAINKKLTLFAFFVLTVLFVKAQTTTDITITQCGTPLGQEIPESGTQGEMIPSIATVTQTGTIGSDFILDFVQIDLTHTFVSDLKITLISPTDTPLILSDSNGGWGDNYTNTIFADGSPNITGDSAPFTGMFEPQGGTFASTFDGEPITGNWTLKVEDLDLFDDGTFNNFCINFLKTCSNQLNCPPDITLECNTNTVAFTNNTPVEIPDGNLTGIDQTINITTIPAGAVLKDITVMVGANHPWVGDISFVLSAPTGESIILLDYPGGATTEDYGNDANFNAGAPILFTDAATVTAENMGNSLTTSGIICLTDGICEYLPNSGPPTSFALLINEMIGNGSDGNGDWSLKVIDKLDSFPGTLEFFTINITYSTSTSETNSSPSITGIPVSTGSCSDPGVTYNDVVSSTGGTEIITRTWTAVFETETQTCDQIITIADTTDPIAICQDITIELDDNGQATISASDVDGGSSDLCGIVTLSVSQTQFSCADLDLVAGSNLSPLLITGVFDGTLPGQTPKGIEIKVQQDITDLSLYSIGSANNGGGTDGEEFTFPVVSATAGEYIYLATEIPNFTAFFGFAPDYIDDALQINGNDAIELFFNSVPIDVFGDINTNGTGQAWEYSDGWAYRTDEQSVNDGIFDVTNWNYNKGAFNGETTNTTAVNPFPTATFNTTPAAPATVIVT